MGPTPCEAELRDGLFETLDWRGSTVDVMRMMGLVTRLHPRSGGGRRFVLPSAALEG